MIVLDSTPLGLIVNRPGHQAGEACREWITRHIRAGIVVRVPAIIAYELRRELLRIGSVNSLDLLDRFIVAKPDRYMPLTDDQLGDAARLWADARNRGIPTSDRHALDIDVILATQTRSLGLTDADYAVATSNVGHLSRFVTARPWQQI